MALISVSNLTFSYFSSGEKIFDDVSFQIDTDWKLGFIGRNGRGKTTFLNLLLKKFEHEGKITSSVDFKYFPQKITDKTLMTFDILDNLYPHFNSEQWRLEKELSLLDIDPYDVLYRPFDTLSNGERTKVLLAAHFMDDSGFLLIDEPTNHLDLEARKVVAKYLKSKKGFILISHDRAFLDECVDHILSINKSNIEVQKGNFSSWYYNKELQDESELAQNEKLKKEMKRLDKSMKQSANWANKTESSKYGNGPVDRGFVGHKAAKMMQGAKNIEGRRQALYGEKSKLLKNVEEADDLKIHPLEHHSENLVIFEDVCLYYDEKKVCKNLNLTVKQGDKIALRGKNGCGKTTVLKLICGNNIKYSGNFHSASSLKVSYIEQDTSNLKGPLSNYISQHKIDETLFKTILRKLDFSREQFEKNIDEYSEGQKKKVQIAKSLCEKAHIYVWDEPLNYIDVFSRMQIENLLLNSDITLIFVEHDKVFAENVAQKIVEL